MMNLKDWITVTLSIVAFLTTAISSYYSFAWQKDALSFQVTDWRRPVVNYEESKLVVPANIVMTFINDGTRPLVAIPYAISLNEVIENEPDCLNNAIAGAKFKVQPQLIKKGEVIVANAVPADDKNGDFSNRLPHRDKFFRVVMCLLIRTNTATMDGAVVPYPVLEFEIDAENKRQPALPERIDVSGRPIKLVEETTWWPFNLLTSSSNNE